jgi:hypothetical protein
MKSSWFIMMGYCLELYGRTDVHVVIVLTRGASESAAQKESAEAVTCILNTLAADVVDGYVGGWGIDENSP